MQVLFYRIQFALVSFSEIFGYLVQKYLVILFRYILVFSSEYFGILFRISCYLVQKYLGGEARSRMACRLGITETQVLFLGSFDMLPECFKRKKNKFKKIQSVNILACRLKPGSRTGEQSGGKEFGFTSGGLSWCWRMLIIIHDNDTQELYDVAL